MSLPAVSSPRSRFASWWRIVALATILLVGLLCNIWWLLRQKEPFGFDAPMHLGISVDLYDRIASAQSPLLSLFDKTDINYPPFGHYVACLMMGLFGRNFQVAALSSTLWLIVLCVACYGIGKDLAGARAGLLSAFLVSFAPSVVGLFRQMYLDVPMTAIAAACVWLLLKTKGFSRWAPSVLLGVLISLGMLTKLQFPIVFFFPLVSILIAERRITKQFLISMAVAAAGCSFWYLKDLGATIGFSLSNVTDPAEIEGDPNVLTLGGLLYYPTHLLGDHLFVPLAIVIGSGVVVALRRLGRKIYPLICWAAGPFAVFTLLRNKDTRYLLPVVPAICVMAAIGIGAIQRKYVKWALSALAGTACLINLILLTFPIMDAPVRLTVPLLGEPFVIASSVTYSTRPAIAQRPLMSLMEHIVQDAARKGWERPRIGVVAHTFELNEIALRALAKYEFPSLRTVGFTYPYVDCRSPADIFEMDYVVTKNGYFAQKAESPVAGANVKRFVISECGAGRPLFRRLASVALWEGDDAQLYVFSPNTEELKGQNIELPANGLPLGHATLTAAFASQEAVRPFEPIFVVTEWAVGADLSAGMQLEFALTGPGNKTPGSFSRWVAAEPLGHRRWSVSVLSVVYPPADAEPGEYTLTLALIGQTGISQATEGQIRLCAMEVLSDDYLAEAPKIVSAAAPAGQFPREIRWTPVPTTYAYELAVFWGDYQIGELEAPRQHVLTSEFAEKPLSSPLELRIRSVGLLGHKGEFSRPLRFVPKHRAIN